MPRLVKGAKETFGWVIVGSGREITIPPSARERYAFHTGEEVIFIKASRKSGGFGLTSRRLLQRSSLPFTGKHVLGQAKISNTWKIVIPDSIPIIPLDRLLTVFGSGYALGFITFGPIFEEALKHLELEEFNP